MENASETPFHYQPLDAEEFSFRILVIQPAVSAEDDLVCKLVDEVFSTSDPYDCISYTWGYEKPSMPLRLNDVDVWIRENLWDGLRRLRRYDGQERRLWADALCIHQEDIEERNSQVARMKDIYARAREVSIWLGERDNSFKSRAERTDDFLRNWTEILRKKPLDSKSCKFSDDHSRDGEVIEGIHDATPWLVGEWWSRIWVLQEAAVCLRDPIFYYGDEQLTWRTLTDFLDAIRTMHRSNLSRNQFRRFMALDQSLVFWGVKDTLAIRTQYQSRAEQKLQDLYLYTTGQSYSDRRDRIFALLGLTNPPCQIKADYNLSMDMVYKLFYKQMDYSTCTHEELCELIRDEEKGGGYKNFFQGEFEVEQSGQSLFRNLQWVQYFSSSEY